MYTIFLHIVTIGYITQYLGYHNNVRICNRELRERSLKVEERESTVCCPLSVFNRLTYIHHPFREHSITLFFNSKFALLSCSVFINHDKPNMKCIHILNGITYSIQIPWEYSTSINPFQYSIPYIIEDMSNSQSLLITPRQIIRFGEFSAAILYLPVSSLYIRYPTKIGGTIHLYPPPT